MIKFTFNMCIGFLPQILFDLKFYMDMLKDGNNDSSKASRIFIKRRRILKVAKVVIKQ